MISMCQNYKLFSDCYHLLLNLQVVMRADCFLAVFFLLFFFILVLFFIKVFKYIIDEEEHALRLRAHISYAFPFSRSLLSDL